jgi:hypothetical protein
MTEQQKVYLESYFKMLISLDKEGSDFYFHHGDCIGADQQAHRIFYDKVGGTLIYLHPPENDKLRAKLDSECYHVYPAKPYLQRNFDIVSATDFLIAAPKEAEETVKSGTWATIRYAENQKKNVVIIRPDGSVIFRDNEEKDDGDPEQASE